MANESNRCSKFCLTCGENYDERGHNFDKYRICYDCVRTGQCACNICLLSIKVPKIVHINVVDRWRGTTKLEHFSNTNDFSKGSMKIKQEMDTLNEKKRKIIHKIGDAQCSANSLIKIKDKSFDQNIMEYALMLMKSAYEGCHHAYIFGPSMEWINIADRMRNNIFNDAPGG